MDEFIKLLDPAYELIQYRIKEDKVIFHIASTIAELECPFCGRKTSKVHSIYEREIQDSNKQLGAMLNENFNYYNELEKYIVAGEMAIEELDNDDIIDFITENDYIFE